MSAELLIWWAVLCAAAALNVAAWCWSAWRYGRRQSQVPAEFRAARRTLLVLSALYVLGCGFRSVFPMVDVPRMCLHDTWVSRIFVGRTVATLAELAFVAQWALLVREAAVAAGAGPAAAVARVLVPLIVAAEIFSWCAVLTTNNLLHAIENSLWTFAAALALAACFSVRRRLDAGGARFISAAIVCAVVYIAFMLTVDVPMYLSRWRADLAAGHEYLGLAAGMRELVARCIVAREWAAWRPDVPWLSLYFTVAVWISIALPHAPPFRGR